MLALRFVLVMGAFLLPQMIQARGTGTDYYLLSPAGKLVGQYRWEWRDHVDAEAELIYRVRGEFMTATPLGQKEPLWKIKSPLAEADWLRSSAAWQSGPGLVALVTTKAIHAFDSKTGAAKYTFPIDKYETLRLRDFLQRGVAAPSLWEQRSDRYRYLAKQSQPFSITKFDVWQGKFLWERNLGAAGARGKEVGAVIPGVAEIVLGSGKFDYMFFDDRTGELLTKLPTGPEQALQVLIDDGVMYHLSKDRKPTLTAFDCGTQKALWSIADLAGVERFVSGDKHGRLLCAAEKQLLVIDTRQKRVQARIAVTGPGSFNFEQTETALFLADQGSLLSIDPTTGKTRWKIAEFAKSGFGISLCVPHPKAQEQDQFIVVMPPPDGKERVLGIVEARSQKDGKAAWSWAVPYVWGDRTLIHVSACRSGYLVQRSWLILD
jgi:outer membrane protein assembly factor BamB